MMKDVSVQFRTALRQGIVSNFNSNELKTLCADLGVNYDDLGGEGLEAKTRELILYLSRRGALSELVAYCLSARPEYAWPQEGPAPNQSAAAPRSRSAARDSQMPLDYTDLVIRIREWNEANGCYPVEAELEDDGSRYEDGQLRLNMPALLANELNAEAYGKELFNALFTGPIRTAYDVATGRASATDGRLRVRLWIDPGAAELHALPWERLYRAGGAVMLPLTTADQTPFSRYTSLSIPEPAPVAERPIRMLAAIANPTGLPGGLPPANLDAEIQNLRRALGEMRKSGKLEVSLLTGRSTLAPELLAQLKSEGYQLLEGGTTLDNLVRYLPGQHILHFIGHGSFQRKTEHGPGQAALHLEKDDGSWKPEKDDDIVKRLAAIGALPHLVFLVACESASRDAKGEDAFVGLGPKLVQAGFPAVVAMQAQVPVETARQLSGEFYRRLMEHGVVDKAMSQARSLTFKPNRTDWGIPVLFMRLKTGELFASPRAEVRMDNEKDSGDVNISGGGVNFGKVRGNITIGGDVVGRDKITTTVTNVTSSSGVDPMQLVKLLQEFADIKRKIGSLAEVEDEDKEDLKTNVQRIEDEVKKGEAADSSKVEKALKKVAAISDDIFAVVVATLSNPAAGIAKAIQLIAQKAKEGK
jgi:hypothetical protein